MLTVPLPDEFSHGDLLADTLDTPVYVVGDLLEFPDLDERSRSRVLSVVKAHQPPPPAPDPVEAARAKVAKAPAGPLRDAMAAVLDAVAGRT
jgi:hypothetical protein